MTDPSPPNDAWTTFEGQVDKPSPTEGGTSKHPPMEELLLPEVEIPTRRRLSPIWLIPLVAALIGGWLAFDAFSRLGPRIVITFHSAEGIQAGKTRIKHKAVEIGQVEEVRLGDEFTHVEVVARLVKGTEPYLNHTTQFWVVRPRLSLSGVSGLGTLVSGAHIEMEPATTKDGKAQRTFKGLEEPPLVRSDSSGTRIQLQADTLGSISTGAPIYYKDITAGEVLGYELSADKKSVIIHAFVRHPYHWLIRENSRFWKSKGIDVSMGAEGVRVKAESLQRLLMGGVVFDTPESMEEGKPVSNGAVFPLFEDRESIQESSYRQRIPFLLFFEGSVRGLKIGAPVEFIGIKVGAVSDIRMVFDRQKTTFRVAVLVHIEPERVSESKDDSAGGTPHELLELLVERGLRARLQMGSYLTGALFVDLTMAPETPIHLVGGNTPYPELPTIPARMEELTASLTEFLTRIQSVPIDRIGAELEGTLKGMNKIANAPELTDSIRSMNRAFKSLEETTAKLDAEAVGDNIAGTAKAAREALETTQKVLAGLGDVVGPEAPLNYRLLELSQELTATSRAIRAFLELMERNPESLVYGKGQKGTP